MGAAGSAQRPRRKPSGLHLAMGALGLHQHGPFLAGARQVPGYPPHLPHCRLCKEMVQDVLNTSRPRAGSC